MKPWTVWNEDEEQCRGQVVKVVGWYFKKYGGFSIARDRH